MNAMHNTNKQSSKPYQEEVHPLDEQTMDNTHISSVPAKRIKLGWIVFILLILTILSSSFNNTIHTILKYITFFWFYG